MNVKLDFAKRDYSMSYSNVSLKSKQREELAAQVAEWEAKGNEVRPFEKAKEKEIHVNHGGERAYKKMGCRCKTCVAWARAKGVLLTEPKTEKVKVENKQSPFGKLQQMTLQEFVENHGESWDYLAARSGYTITAYQLRRIYEGQSEATLLDWNVLKTTLDILGVEA
ncbi:hypothetical protein [Acinetobacter pittii]|uniref:hypothetical protein n=1 Tax=Acinetobacter pittii TaxID=48296 RepID=UPI00226F792A|nr:hypothetical protein [Acinetobacter pittii]